MNGSMVYALAVLQMSDEGDAEVAGGILGILMGLLVMAFSFAVAALMIAGMWKIFTKAGKPGWAALVPIYNIVILLEIVGKPLWWIVLFVVPCANFVAMIMISLEIAKVFGKSTGYAIGLMLLPMIFYPMLGFGDARYQAPPPVA